MRSPWRSCPLFLALIWASFLVGPVASVGATVEVTTCGQQVIGGRGFLSGDLDCAGWDGYAIHLAGARLDLNGFTITGGMEVGVLCSTRCRIEGPGTITGSRLDNVTSWSDKTLKIRNVTVSNSALGHGISAIAVIAKIVARDVTVIGNAGSGLDSSHLVRLKGGTVTGNGTYGVRAGPSVLGGKEGKVVARGASISGNGVAPECGDSVQCADVATAARKAPRLRDTTCDTSYQLGSGVPGLDWDVCALD